MTTIIYCKNSSSKKKRNSTAKQRELNASWEQLLKKYTPKSLPKETKRDLRDVYSLGISARRETPKYPSLNSGHHDCSKKESPVYTGTKIKGIGTMHKSNAVPVFSDQEAKDIATMRRN
jgi:hypothetical protein